MRLFAYLGLWAMLTIFTAPALSVALLPPPETVVTHHHSSELPLATQDGMGASTAPSSDCFSVCGYCLLLQHNPPLCNLALLWEIAPHLQRSSMQELQVQPVKPKRYLPYQTRAPPTLLQHIIA